MVGGRNSLAYQFHSIGLEYIDINTRRMENLHSFNFIALHIGIYVNLYLWNLVWWIGDEAIEDLIRFSTNEIIANCKLENAIHVWEHFNS